MRPVCVVALCGLSLGACTSDPAEQSAEEGSGTTQAVGSSTSIPGTDTTTGDASGSSPTTTGGESSGADEASSSTQAGSSSTAAGSDSSDGSSSSSTGEAASPLPDWEQVGPAQVVCSSASDHWPPTVAALDETFAVGCVPTGSQQMFPTVHFVDETDGEIGSDNLLNSDGYYYLDISLSSYNGRLQATYQFNCDDNGSWNEGWGWGCVDFREYDSAGQRLNNATVFGTIGHSGHPVTAWSGSSYGVGWISYDDVFFRRLDSDGEVSGGPADNVHVGPDPEQPDQRDGARTKIVWNAERQEYAIYAISGYNLYRARVGEAGNLLGAPALLTDTAYSQTFGGQFVAAAWGEHDYLLYHDETDLVLARVFADGGMAEVVVQEGDYRFPSMVATDEALLVFRTQPGTGFGEVLAYDPDLQALPEYTGLLGEGVEMRNPQGAVDPVSGRFAVAYNDGDDVVLRLVD
ncbi:MAG: hypothetical protein KUG77_02800 [Nannocystaceae bacterium]|nr:hypothetical protein [Nannocystaceae bacterium]